jgi:3',5'-cyclic AMP phosphodiesterase CpdA
MKKTIIPMLLLLALAACNKEEQELRFQPIEKGGNELACKVQKSLKIAILSDLHFMDPSLLQADGTAFQMYLMQDPKLLAESKAILQQIIRRLLAERPDLVLISGDLTKDGEMASHKSVLKQLQVLTSNHIKVLVVPGNHDINNPDAKIFNGDNAFPTQTINPQNFVSLYAAYGYKNAISRDLNSLSYVSEPFKDLRILALDANEYYANTPSYCVVAGKIKDATMEWAKKQLADAKSKGKTVIGLMHHGLLEHFPGESFLFADYLVDDYEAKADELIQAGLKVIFTGHFHSHDAVERTNEFGAIVDLETGSPVTYDSPFRIMTLSGKKLSVRTENIEHIVYPGLVRGTSFHDYEKEFTRNGIEIQAKYMLMGDPFNVDEPTASQIAPIFAEAMLTHFAGDEIITAEAEAQIQDISQTSPDLAGILQGLYTDLPPTDNDLVVDLD